MKRIILSAVLLLNLLCSNQAQAWPWDRQAPTPKPQTSQLCTTCTASDAGYSIIRKYEGYVPVKYLDAAGKLTIGYGHLILPGEDFTGPLTPERAKALLASDVKKSERSVNTLVQPAIHQYQFDALNSFTFNLGGGNLASSTLLKRVNAKRDADAAMEFMRWVNAGGKKLLGLVNRRQAESLMYQGL